MTAFKRVEQMIFDRVCQHLAKQGKRSKDGYDACLYRGPNGLKCAVGALLPDNLYKPEYEGKNAARVCVSSDWLVNYSELLASLQESHDHGHSLNDLKGYLIHAVYRFKLDPTAISTITTWEG